MDKEKIIKAIGEQMEDINEQFGIIRGYEGKIPNIELDLLLSNIRKVYDAFLQLEKINQPVIAFNIDSRKSDQEKGRVAEGESGRKGEGESGRKGEEEKEEIEVLEVPIVLAPEVKPEVKPDPLPIHEAAKEEVAAEPEPMEEEVAVTPMDIPEPVEVTVREEPVIEPEPIVEKQEEAPEPVKHPEPAPVAELRPDPVPEVHVRANPPAEDAKQVKTTLDLFGESSSTLADRLKDTAEKRVADKLKPAKIQDIKTAIGINEKFLFINELFDGSLKNYEDAISRLNNCATEGQADMLLAEYQSTYGWDTDNPTAQSFIALVNRKF